MNTNDHGRKEPSLSDLEAFERLLRESLHDEPVAKHPVPTPAAATPMTKADHDAMAELTRLIEQPLDFALPDVTPRPPQPEPHAALAAPDPVVSVPEAVFVPEAFDPVPPEPVALPEPAELRTHVDAEFAPGWPAPPHVETHLAALPPLPEPVVAAVTPEDPLAAFEEELRRFDASRLGQPTVAAPVVAEAAPLPPLPEPGFPEPAAFETPDFQAQPAASPAFQHDAYHEPAVYAPRPAPTAPAEPAHAEHAFAAEAAPLPKSSALDAMEERLAAEAAAASYAPDEQQTSDVRRSRGVFMALGGLAVAGLAVVGGVFAFGGSKKATTSGDVPVIAAKKEPTKEKPADPGGVEIPNQNAQILSGKDVIKDTGPAKQVVNTTEQPLDLKEVTRRESVRIVTPNPFQQGNQTPVVESPSAAQKPADVEPRRVTSVRVPTGGETAGTGGAGLGAAAAVAGAGAAALAANAAAPKPPKAEAPKAEAPRVIATAPGDAAKSEARPPKKTETPKKAETPKTDAAKATTPAKVANASATPKAKAPEKATPQRSANAPLQLNTDQPKAKAAPTGASGTYAVQLASRPTESDARAAAGTLGSKYSAQLGGKATRVTSGEANGQTVYRVRVGGYSQQAATEACNRIKASGGSCFIAKQ